jgi:hypothetical protein
MGTGGTSGDSREPDGDNVIRFPREWFGSKDDLIPIGPAADRAAEARAAAQREQELNAAREHEEILTGSEFWGESSGALHQPVDLPRADKTEAVEPTAVHRVTVEGLDEVATSPLTRTRARRLRVRRGPRFPSITAPRWQVPRAAIGLAAMVAAALALFASGVFQTDPHPARAVSSNVSSAAPTRLTPFLTSAQNVLVSQSRTVLWQATRPLLVKAVPAHHLRHRPRRTRGTQPAVHHVARTHRRPAAKPESTVVAEAPTTSAAPSRDLVPASGSPAVSSMPAVGSAPAAESPVPANSTPSASSTPAADSAPSTSQKSDTPASSASSPTSSGPAGLGGVVGKQCNPKCSG